MNGKVDNHTKGLLSEEYIMNNKSKQCKCLKKNIFTKIISLHPLVSDLHQTLLSLFFSDLPEVHSIFQPDESSKSVRERKTRKQDIELERVMSENKVPNTNNTFITPLIILRLTFVST